MRRSPHWNKDKLSIKSLAMTAFNKLFRRAASKGEVTGSELRRIGNRARRLGFKLWKRSLAAKRKARRDMQKRSRRINFGLIPGNSRRRR